MVPLAVWHCKGEKHRPGGLAQPIRIRKIEILLRLLPCVYLYVRVFMHWYVKNQVSTANSGTNGAFYIVNACTIVRIYVSVNAFSIFPHFYFVLLFC